MLQQFLSLVLVGLGIVHGSSQGMVAGIFSATSAGIRNTTEEREIKAVREKSKDASKSAHAAFQQKLSTIRDEKKKALAEKLNTTLNDVNTKRTDAMLAYLVRVSEILEKISTRAATAKSAGKDTSKLDAAIAKAQAAIATAKSAILAQAGKQYTATIASENTVRTDMGTTMKQLQSDVAAVKDLVTAAHKSVGEAVKALAAVLGESRELPATASGGRR